MLKKVCACLLSAILILTFSGCNKDKSKEITSPEDLLDMSKAEIEDIYELEEDEHGYLIKELPNDVLDELISDDFFNCDIRIDFQKENPDAVESIYYMIWVKNAEKNVVFEKINNIYEKINDNTKKDISQKELPNRIPDIPKKYMTETGFNNDFETNNGNFLGMNVGITVDENDANKVSMTVIKITYATLVEITRT